MIIIQQIQLQQQRVTVLLPLLLQRICCRSSNTSSRPIIVTTTIWKTTKNIRNATTTTMLQIQSRTNNFTTTTGTSSTTTTVRQHLQQQQQQQQLTKQQRRELSSSSVFEIITTETDNNNNHDLDDDNDNNNSTNTILTDPEITITKSTNTTNATKSTKSNTNNNYIISLESIETKELVTSLLQSTYNMMKHNSIIGIQQSIDKYNNNQVIEGSNKNNSTPQHQPKYQHQHQHIIAYSGGIDSTLVAKLIQECYTSLSEDDSDNDDYFTKQNNSILAVLGISNAVSIEQQQLGEQIARNELQIPYTTIPTNEGSDNQYILNNGTACYTCKSYLYNTIQSIHTKYTNTTTNNTSDKDNNNILYSVSLYNGTNKDDIQDITRVGLLAAAEYNVHSPINILSKQQVRQVAKYFNLSNYNLVSNPCLRSRLQINTVLATSTNLYIVDTTERIIKHYLLKSIPEFTITTTNIRVRLVSLSKIYIEIDYEYVDIVSNINWYTIFTNYNNNTTTEAKTTGSSDNNDDIDTTKATTSKTNNNNIQLNFSSIVVRPFKSGSISKITDATKKLQEKSVSSSSSS